MGRKYRVQGWVLMTTGMHDKEMRSQLCFK